MKVSFDFDGTLEHKYVQEIALRNLKVGDEVYIVTSRCKDNYNEDLFKIAEQLGIKKDNIYFTNGQYKADALRGLGVELHYDDMYDEVNEINVSVNNCMAVLVGFITSEMAWLLNGSLSNGKFW